MCKRQENTDKNAQRINHEIFFGLHKKKHKKNRYNSVYMEKKAQKEIS